MTGSVLFWFGFLSSLDPYLSLGLAGTQKKMKKEMPNGIKE